MNEDLYTKDLRQIIPQLLKLKHHYLEYYETDPVMYSEYLDNAKLIKDLLNELEKIILQYRTPTQENKRLHMLLHASEILRGRKNKNG